MVEKKVFLFFTFLLVIFPLVSSVDFQMKENLTRGETIMAKISGNFLNEPTEQSIFLYRKNGQIQAPMQFKVEKLGEEYYLYGQTFKEGNPLIEDNYSIVIKNIKYIRVLGEITTEEIVKNFTVTSEIADFFVEPGFIETRDNFTLTVKNLQDKTISIKVIVDQIEQTETGNSSEGTGLWDRLFGGGSSSNSSEEATEKILQVVSLIPGEEKEIKITSFRSSKDEMKNLALQTEKTLYNLPVYVLASTVTDEEPVVIVEKEKFYFEEDKIEVFLLTNETLEKKINLVNNAGIDLTNVTLEYTYSLEGVLNVTTKKIKLVEDKESKGINLEIGLSKEELNKIMNSSDSEKSYYGFIKAEAVENLSTKLEVNITFFKSNVSLPKPKDKTCAQLSGKICNETSRCVGETKYLRENNAAVNCCVGTCENSAPGSFWKFLGWIILVCVIIFLVWFFLKKYRGAKNEISLLQVATRKK